MNRYMDGLLRAALPAGALAAAAVFASLAAAPASAQKFPEFPDARLKQGRTIWLGTCEACHANDVAGAPLVTNKSAWVPRLAKGKDALYKSALGGLTGPEWRDLAREVREAAAKGAADREAAMRPETTAP